MKVNVKSPTNDESKRVCVSVGVPVFISHTIVDVSLLLSLFSFTSHYNSAVLML